MAKSFMRLQNINKNSKNNIQSSIDYMARLEEYSDRQDLITTQVFYLPELYRSTSKHDIDGIKDFYNDFEKYSRKDRRLALSVIFDLPVTKERKDLTKLDNTIYPKIVKNFIDKINENYCIVTFQEEKIKTEKTGKVIKENIIKKQAMKKEDIPNHFQKIERIYIPSLYSIHLLEKKGDKCHPHCHMLISTLSYTKEDLLNCNCTKEEVIRKGINNRFLSKTSFYYDIYEYFSSAANEELKKLGEKIGTDKFDNFYLNMRNAEILREERKRFGELASSFSNMEIPQLTYTENLMINNAMHELEEDYKSIDNKLKEINEKTKDIKQMLNINESDKELLKFIVARNKVGESFLKAINKTDYKILAPILERSVRQGRLAKEIPTNFKGHRIIEKITNGINAKDIVKPKVRTLEVSSIPSYDYGSMEDYNMEIKEKTEIFKENNKNIETINHMLNKFMNEYFNAVKAYNGYDEEYIEKNKRKFLESRSGIENEIEAISVKEDRTKKREKVNYLIKKIAKMDYMIFAAISNRKEGNLIKNCFQYGKLQGNEKKWELEEYINLNSNITYSLVKDELITSTYEQAKEALNLLKTQKQNLEKFFAKGKTQQEKAKISFEIQTAVNSIAKIDNAINKFEKYEKPKLIEQFSTVSSKGIKFSPTVAARYEKEIAYLKSSLTNFKILEEKDKSYNSFQALFNKAQLEYKNIDKPNYGLF